MTKKTLLFQLVLVALLAGSILAIQQQTTQARSAFFVQLADTQFGFFAGDRDFVQETANYEFVVANINRLRPQFVVICGDLINKVGDPAQTAEYLRITARIDGTIPVYAVAGNHDVENEPTPESLAYYRQYFGKDYYSFREGDVYGVVLNSSLIAAPAKAQREADQQEAWLKQELIRAKASGAPHIVVFQHHSWFLEKADEPAQYFNIPLEQRRRYLEMLKGAGVRYVFAGHYHRNALGKDGDLEMITSGPVGRPLGTDPSGIRLVTVTPMALQHRYFTLGEIPNQFPAPAARGSGRQ